MAGHHASSGQVIPIQPFGERLRDAQSVALVRDDRIEVMRLALPAGKELPEHFAYGPVTIVCIEGEVDLAAHDTVKRMRTGDFVYLAAKVPHALRAAQDASVLITMVLRESAA